MRQRTNDTVELPVPALRFAVHEDGTLEHLGPWFPHIHVSDEVLARADGRRLFVRDGILVFRCTNGGARYVLSGSTIPGIHYGRLVESWAPSC